MPRSGILLPCACVGEMLASSRRLRDSLYARRDPLFKCCQALAIIQISNVTEVPKIERNIAFVLSDKDDFSSKSMGNTNLIEDVRIAARAVGDHQSRPVDQRDDILHNGRVLPNVVCPTAS